MKKIDIESKERNQNWFQELIFEKIYKRLKKKTELTNKKIVSVINRENA